jgi:hypothetical protein
MISCSHERCCFGDSQESDMDGTKWKHARGCPEAHLLGKFRCLQQEQEQHDDCNRSLGTAQQFGAHSHVSVSVASKFGLCIISIFSRCFFRIFGFHED